VDVEVEAEEVEEEEDAEEEKEEEGGRRRRTTLIKSNNPHLAGGEQPIQVALRSPMSWAMDGIWANFALVVCSSALSFSVNRRRSRS
jgi:hypothetical protein